MRIREVATQVGVSHQAIYKRLKARGITVESITEKATGELTGEGMAIMIELYPNIKVAQPKVEEKQSSAVDQVVETLKSEVQRLGNELRNSKEKIESLNERIEALTEERDFLRQALTNNQELEGLRTRLDVLEAAQRATQAKAITDGKKRRGFWGWISKHGDNNQ